MATSIRVNSYIYGNLKLLFIQKWEKKKMKMKMKLATWH